MSDRQNPGGETMADKEAKRRVKQTVRLTREVDAGG
jgi:hypothetical protein